MNPTILNRDFQHPDDGWYQIEPKGEFPNRTAGVVQVIDDTAVETIVNRFNADAAGPNFAGMLIDHEHFKHDQDKETIAYGWLTRLQNRDDGIYGQIRWTNTGRAAVDGGDYRFFSTEYDGREMKVLNSQPKRVRPVRLDGLTLTNSPNNKGGRPITNRSLQTATKDDADNQQFRREPGSSMAENETKTKNRTMKSVATQLKLSADASEEAVLAEVNKLMNRATEAEGKLVPLQAEATELKAENKKLKDGQIDADLELYKNRFKPEAKELWKSLLVTNREAAMSALKDLPILNGSGKSAGTTANGSRILNREEGKTPGNREQAATDDGDEKALADKIRNRASELQGATPGRSFDSCWSQAQREASAKS